MLSTRMIPTVLTRLIAAPYAGTMALPWPAELEPLIRVVVLELSKG